MESLKWIFVAVLIVISAFSVIFCIIRGRGTSHKMLIFFTSMLAAMAAVCFGGQFVLSHFDMGWRCTPFNTMLFLCAVLFIVMLGFSMKELSILKDTNPTIVWCGCISMLLMIVITLLSTLSYFQFTSFSDGLAEHDNQTIVCASNGHGSFGERRYYIHINDLVHGVEITQAGWYGVPSRPHQ